MKYSIEPNFLAKFRNVLEAQWGLFLDACHAGYLYNPPGFGANGWFLPDFYIPHSRIWLEIRPEQEQSDYKEHLENALLFAQEQGEAVVILYGPPACKAPQAQGWAVGEQPDKWIVFPAHLVECGSCQGLSLACFGTLEEHASQPLLFQKLLKRATSRRLLKAYEMASTLQSSSSSSLLMAH